jgi:predicted nucleic acid-binding protein
MNADRVPAAFVDTNILVYAMAGDDLLRAPVAQTLIKRLMTEKTFRTSTQVLQELFVTLTRKGRKPSSADEALRYLDRLAAYPIVTLDYGAIRAAGELSARETLSFWDALIVIAAVRARAERLYSEDLQDGRVILGVRIVNPFR